MIVMGTVYCDCCVCKDAVGFDGPCMGTVVT